MSEPRIIYEGSTEPFEAEVSARAVLDTEVIEVSFDGGTTWKPMNWAGTAAKVRTATLTVSLANLPTFPFECIALFRLDGSIRPGLSRRVIGREIPVV